MSDGERRLCRCGDVVQVPAPRLARNADRLSELFIHRNDRRGAAVLVTHQRESEVRLLISAQVEIVQTQVCRSQVEVVAMRETWKAALGEKGAAG